MQTISQSEAEGKLGSIMDMAQSEPVLIERAGAPAVIISSIEDYEKRSRDASDTEAFIAFCNSCAEESMKNGMTEEILNSILAEDNP